MKYAPRIQKAVEFSIKVHAVDQDQRRKGTGIPYITHPITVGLILSQAKASEDVIIAGLLHDTIEDCNEDSKVTKETIEREFGSKVADLVMSVTEDDKKLEWEERKEQAIKHISDFSNDSVLLKSADLVANSSEIYSDYQRNGEKVFERFSRGKKILENYKRVATTLLEKWPENPLAEDLKDICKRLDEVVIDEFC